MASGSMRETSKAIDSFIANTKDAVSQLPQETGNAIKAFFKKYSDIDARDSQRLQEELLTIYKSNDVGGEDGKLGNFALALATLRPVINGQARLQEWWTLIVVKSTGLTKRSANTINNMDAFIMAILDGEGKSMGDVKIADYFLSECLERYLADAAMLENGQQALAHWSLREVEHFERLLVDFGRRKPKEFLQALDRIIVPLESRVRGLHLLGLFTRHQPLPLEVVKETLLIEHLLKCLMIDTSNTAISLALNALIMFLPHIPSTAITHLPRLFLIYSRILCWERFSSTPTESKPENFADTDDSEVEKREVAGSQGTEDEQWEKLLGTDDGSEKSRPEMLLYFTFLYGLYPLNFMTYIRKPRKYLKSINFPHAEKLDLDQTTIRSRTERYQRLHLLHPNFYDTTVEEELIENRWSRTEPSEVVAECMSLSIASLVELGEPGPPGPPPMRDLPLIPESAAIKLRHKQHALLYKESDIRPVVRRHDSISSATPSADNSNPTDASSLSQPAAPDSPTVPPQEAPPPSSVSGLSESTPLFNFFQTYSPQHHNLQPHNAPFTPQHHDLSGTGAGDSIETPPTLSTLQRQNQLLRSDLTYQRYLNHQQRLRESRLTTRYRKERLVEVETQNLVNSNRSLKAKLARAKEEHSALMRETTVGRTQARRWEADLVSKLRRYKEVESAWGFEKAKLGIELEEAREALKAADGMLEKDAVGRMEVEMDVSRLKIDHAEISQLRKKIVSLEGELRATGKKEREAAVMRQRRAEVERAFDEVKEELERTRTLATAASCEYRKKVRELEEHIADLQRNPTLGRSMDTLHPKAQALLEHALRNTGSKYAALKAQYTTLRHRCSELEMRCQELEEDATDTVSQTLSMRGGSASPMMAPRVRAVRSVVGEDQMGLPPPRPIMSAPPLPDGFLEDIDASEMIAAVGLSAAPKTGDLNSAGSGVVDPRELLQGVAGGPRRASVIPPLPGGASLSRALSSATRMPSSMSPKARAVLGDDVSFASAFDLGGGRFGNPSVPVGGGLGGAVEITGLRNSSGTGEATSGTSRSSEVYSDLKSTFSADSLDSLGAKMAAAGGKQKVTAKSETRMYGRGGVQNIGKAKIEDQGGGGGGGDKGRRTLRSTKSSGIVKGVRSILQG